MRDERCGEEQMKHDCKGLSNYTHSVKGIAEDIVVGNEEMIFNTVQDRRANINIANIAISTTWNLYLPLGTS